MLKEVLKPTELLVKLRNEGIAIWEEEGKLKYKAPIGALTGEDIGELRKNKEEIIKLLKAEKVPVKVQLNPNERNEPFPLTDVQSAYLLGRSEVFDYGGVACHIYIELSYPDLDPHKTEKIWNRLIARHEMLRARIDTDGYQHIMNEVPEFKLNYTETVNWEESKVTEKLEEIRNDMGHRIYDTEKWPLFDVAVTKTKTKSYLHFSMEFLIADWASIWMLLTEFEVCYVNENAHLPQFDLSFRDYLVAEKALQETAAYEKDRQYWLNRIDTLPTAPELPLSNRLASKGKGHFTRHNLQLSQEDWTSLKKIAQQKGLTPTTVVMTAYAAVLERWSRNSAFCLNLTVLNRLPLHQEVNAIVGDFTSVSLLALDWAKNDSFVSRAKTINNQLFDDLDHRLFSGVEVMREMARKRGRKEALMPYVFTSAIGLTNPEDGHQMTGQLEPFGISQTPQVFIDCQAMDTTHGLHVNWDVRDGIFPKGLIEDMFATYEKVLRQLVYKSDSWGADNVVQLPEHQARERALANSTKIDFKSQSIHEAVVEQIKSNPERVALVHGERVLKYGDLGKSAASIADELVKNGCQQGDRVAITMKKGIGQVKAAIGVLSANAVYVPIDANQPVERRNAIIRNAGIKFILTEEDLGTDLPEVITFNINEITINPEANLNADIDPNASAYIIFTSGSTGTPKGVEISHESAVNTILDINDRFNVNENDAVLALAQLGFDLSVFDIFGLLAVGGKLVFPEEERKTDPSHWVDLIVKHKVSVWNTVPALMQMLVNYLKTSSTELSTLRLALLSGDWIPMSLPDAMKETIPATQLVSLGGATEASIWSNYHVFNGMNEDWNSIPYGKPLSNQGFRILDEYYRDCPVWSTGELFITGKGLAKGYVNNPEVTTKHFFQHPKDGQRFYRTGDLGRYMPGGEIEFLGREDNQVKIRGHRIELGEIEAALTKHPEVESAAVLVDGNADNKSLLGIVTSKQVDVKKPRASKQISAILMDTGTFESKLNRLVTLKSTLNEGKTISVFHLTEKIENFQLIGPLSEDINIQYNVVCTDKTVLKELEELHKTEGVNFLHFDFEKEIRSQGVVPNSFDLILLPQELEKAKEVSSILKCISCPDGWLLYPSEFELFKDGTTHYVYDIKGSDYILESVKWRNSLIRPSDLSQFLLKWVPAYMVPSHIQIVDQMPITSNGKLDRKVMANYRPAQFADNENNVVGGVIGVLEEQLKAIWTEGLGITQIGRSQNFYDLGADSLIMARVAGKIRDLMAEDKDLKPIPYDALLTQILNFPTIEALSEFIYEKSNEEAPEGEELLTDDQKSNAVLTTYAKNDEGPLRVVFHAGLGTMNCFHPLLGVLKDENLGPVIGVTVKDTDRYCEFHHTELIEKVAEDYTDRLMATGHKSMQLIGYCLGGQFAIEVARRLLERGVDLVDMVLVDSHPVYIDVQDDLVIESLFIPNLGISMEAAGFGGASPEDIGRTFMQIIQENNGVIPEGAPGKISGDPGLEKVANMFKKLSEFSLSERFTVYVETIEKVTGERMEVEMAEGLFKVYRQSYRASNFYPAPYMGDIRFLKATGDSGFLSGTDEKTINYWDEVCLGDFSVQDIEGNHFSCIEEPHLEELAKIIAEPLKQEH